MKPIIFLSFLALAGCSEFAPDKHRSADIIYGGAGRARVAWAPCDDLGGHGPYTAACSRDIIHHEKDYNVSAIAYKR